MLGLKLLVGLLAGVGAVSIVYVGYVIYEVAIKKVK